MNKEQIGQLLGESAPNQNGTLHERVARECWKHHWQNFIECEEPACVLLKRLATAAGWVVDINGVRRPEPVEPVVAPCGLKHSGPCNVACGY